MANIINIEDFFEGGELNIAGTETTSIEDRVNWFIDKYETEYLQKALGYPLWKVFNADNYPTPGTDRFKDLLNGKEFTDERGFTRKWIGLKVTDKCPIADYVWYYYQRDNVSFTSVTGEVKGSSENASNASVMTKQCRAWNEMIDISHLLWQFLTANATTYPEFDIAEVDICELQKINTFNL